MLYKINYFVHSIRRSFFYFFSFHTWRASRYFNIKYEKCIREWVDKVGV